MKKLYTLTLLCILSFSLVHTMLPPSEEFVKLLKSVEYNTFLLFRRFIVEFDKSYESMEELNLRHEIFRENLVKTQGKINQFMDLTSEEFASKYLVNVKIPEESLVNIKKITKDDITIRDLPENFDWRDKNVVTPVKNQKQCGSCWAFSAVGNIESQYAIKYNTQKIFSEQQIVDCDIVDHGCGGGFPNRAFDYIKQAGGLEYTSDYPYTGRGEKCTANSQLFHVNVDSYFSISEDEEVIKAALVEYGPLSVALNATMLQFYFGGILNVKPPFTCNPAELDHAVLLVGYGVHNGEKYWLVKNSWGKLWGEHGYFKIIRGKGECGINTQVITSQIK